MNSRYTTLTNAQFLLTETTLTVQELGQGQSWAQLREAAREGRLYGPGKANSQLTILNAIRKRLSGTSEEEWKLMTAGTLEQRQLLNLAFITREKQLLLDFLAEVIVTKWRSLDRYVTDMDTRTFLVHKAEQEPEVAYWSAESTRKTRGNLTRYLMDAGILGLSGKGKFEILAQYLSGALKEVLSTVNPSLLRLLEELK